MREINRVLMISKMTELEFDEFKLGAAVDEYHKLRASTSTAWKRPTRTTTAASTTPSPPSSSTV